MLWNSPPVCRAGKGAAKPGLKFERRHHRVGAEHLYRFKGISGEVLSHNGKFLRTSGATAMT